MDRREFILRSMAALPAIAIGSSLLSGCKKEDFSPIDTDKRILVIGAGMAGLAAAWYFRQRGVEVTVLEGRDRIGGRIATDRSEGFAFDLGASWIHGPRGNPITEVAENAGATLYKTNDDSVKVYDQGGSQYDDGDLSSAEREFEKAMEKVKENGNQSDSFLDVFQAQFPEHVGDRLWTYMLSAYLEFDTGADVDRLSSLNFDDDEAYKGADKIITNGYDKLTDYLADGLDIRLNAAVTMVDSSGGNLSVATDTDVFEADYLIVTVPLGVLQSGDIAFSPSLPPAHSEAANRLQMGTVNKFLLLWDSPFWDTDLQYIGYTPSERGKFNYFLNTRTFSSYNGLMTFTFGDYSIDAEQLSDADVQNAIMAHLREIYPSAPDPSIFKRTRWASDPFALGTYTFSPVGASSADYDALAQPVGDRIFFAGEHTSREYRGTVHGAYESGLSQAKRIAEILVG